jgi:uncharacterized protein YrrD
MTLRTFSLLKGLPVFASDGQKLGLVHDLCISEAGQVAGLVIEQQKLFKKNVYVALDKVASFGPDGVIVYSLVEGVLPESYMLLNKNALLGKMLFSEMGEELGLLQDVCFMEKLGTIVAYETTDGFFSKSKLIHTEQPPVYGEDAIIVSVLKQ